MLKKTIVYEDFNGDEVSEVFHFHLSKAELVELEMSKKGGLSAWIQNIIDSDDGNMIMAEFKKLLLLSYGVKTADGKRFVKNEKLREEFLSSEAYSTLFMQLVQDAEAAAEFVSGIVPHNMQNELQIKSKTTSDVRNEPVESETFVPRVLTRAEIVEMDADELKSKLASGEVTLG